MVQMRDDKGPHVGGNGGVGEGWTGMMFHLQNVG